MIWYIGPSPPSGGVSRPPLAVIAPHCTQFDGFTISSTWPFAGAEDRGTPPAMAERIATTAPNGELLVIEGAGHFPFAETPDRYWPAVVDWLTRTAR